MKNNMQQTLILILGGASGAIVTFLLQKYGCSAVVASCFVGLVGALLGHFLKLPHFPLVVFAGSFAGMTSLTIGTIPLILLAGALTGLLYSISLHIFVGFGGRLGTIAFVSTILSFYALFFSKKLKGLLIKF
jgi:uncharacterized membrane protein YeaQ/YmgE (transglycosylase-associated protein family)